MIAKVIAKAVLEDVQHVVVVMVALQAVNHRVPDVEVVADVRELALRVANLLVLVAPVVLVGALVDAQAADLAAVLAQVAQGTAAVIAQEHVVLLVLQVAVAVAAADLDVVENVLQAVREVAEAHARLAVVMLVLVVDLDVQMLALVDAGALAEVVVLQLVEDALVATEIVALHVEPTVRVNVQVLVVQDAVDVLAVQAHAELVVVVTVIKHVKPDADQGAEQHVAELVKQIVVEHVQDVVQLVLVDVLHVLDAVDVQDVRVIVPDVLDVQVVVKAAVVIAVILLVLKPVILAATLVLPQFTKRTK